MTKQELESRITKKNNEIEKIEKRISKWTEGMNENAKTLCAACELMPNDKNFKTVRKSWFDYKMSNYNNPTVFRQDYENKGPNFDEAYRAYRDLGDAKATLNKYNEQLKKLEEFTNAEKIKVIWDFLTTWKEKAYNYIVKNVEEYFKLKQNYDQAEDEYLEKVKDEIENAPFNKKMTVKVRLINAFKEKYYKNIDALTKEVYLSYGRYDDEKLKKILDKDVQHKYTKFISQIEKKAGAIKDVTGLRIGLKGDINGYVIGDKSKVHVETITAGGYNIQCFHYRTLVNNIK